MIRSRIDHRNRLRNEKIQRKSSLNYSANTADDFPAQSENNFTSKNFQLYSLKPSRGWILIKQNFSASFVSLSVVYVSEASSSSCASWRTFVLCWFSHSPNEEPSAVVCRHLINWFFSLTDDSAARSNSLFSSAGTKVACFVIFRQGTLNQQQLITVPSSPSWV